jgi:hypothetical protein
VQKPNHIFYRRKKNMAKDKETKKTAKKTAKESSKKTQIYVVAPTDPTAEVLGKELLHDLPEVKKENLYLLKNANNEILTIEINPEKVVVSLYEKLQTYMNNLNERLSQVKKGLADYAEAKETFANISMDEEDPKWIAQADEMQNHINAEIGFVMSVFTEIGGNAPMVFINNNANIDICGYKIVKAIYSEII